MIATEHPDCSTCSYWLSRIDEERAHALAGNAESYLAEIRAKRELDEHLSRDTHTAAQSVEVSA
jgi:hypothetical protein